MATGWQSCPAAILSIYAISHRGKIAPGSLIRNNVMHCWASLSLAAGVPRIPLVRIINDIP